MSEKQTVNLDELVGLHELTGVEMTTAPALEYRDGPSQVMNFVLDGKTYSAVEDPEDGYRSMLGELYVSDTKLVNNFAPVQVMVSPRPSATDILDFVDVENGKIVLAVGTANSDDFYPSFVAEWTPENLSVNEGKAKP